MRILVDTHIFLWAVFEPKKLSEKHKAELKSRSNVIYVSPITLVEIMIKNSTGKLAVHTGLLQVIEDSGFELIEYTGNDAMALKDLPMHHKDPFDRMLIAQAITNKFQIMSEDGKFKYYDCKLI